MNRLKNLFCCGRGFNSTAPSESAEEDNDDDNDQNKIPVKPVDLRRDSGLSRLSESEVIANSVLIGAFNIQKLKDPKTFGEKKYEKRLSRIAEIIRRYDIVFLCELQDVGGEKKKQLETLVGSKKYDFYYSTGKNSRERDKCEYAYYVRRSTLAKDGTVWLHDSQGFSRPPLIGEFKLKGRELVVTLVGIHVTFVKKEIANELETLHELAESLKAASQGEGKLLAILGDLNTDGEYIKTKEIDSLNLWSRNDQYRWLIPPWVSTKTDSTNRLDNIIIVDDEQIEWKTGLKGRTYRFDRQSELKLPFLKAKDKKVKNSQSLNDSNSQSPNDSNVDEAQDENLDPRDISDHCPIEFEIPCRISEEIDKNVKLKKGSFTIIDERKDADYDLEDLYKHLSKMDIGGAKILNTFEEDGTLTEIRLVYEKDIKEIQQELENLRNISKPNPILGFSTLIRFRHEIRRKTSVEWDKIIVEPYDTDISQTTRKAKAELTFKPKGVTELSVQFD